MVLLGIVLLFICQAQIPRNVLIRCSGLCVDIKHEWCSGCGCDLVFPNDWSFEAIVTFLVFRLDLL